jgi:DnaJ-class molecular chaperone
VKIFKRCEVCRGTGYIDKSRTGSYWFDYYQATCQKCKGKGKIVIEDKGGKKK